MKRQKKPIIALAQIKYYDTSKESNVEKIKKFIRLAKKKNADIVCFPESCVHKTIFFSKNHKLINEIKQKLEKKFVFSKPTLQKLELQYAGTWCFLIYSKK